MNISRVPSKSNHEIYDSMVVINTHRLLGSVTDAQTASLHPASVGIYYKFQIL